MDRKYSDAMNWIHIKDEILDKPLSFNQTRHMVDFILKRMSNLERIMEHQEKHGEDISKYEYELHCAEYALGLREKPDVRDYDFYYEYFNKKKEA